MHPRPICVLLLLALLTACGAVSPRTSATAPLATAELVITPLPTTAPALPPTESPQPVVTALPIVTATPVPPTWRFVVLGDTRTAGLDPPPAMAQIVQNAAAAQPEVVLIMGDLINAMDDQASVREQWRRWNAALAPLGATHVLPTPGNHDVQGHAWATDLMVEAFPELPRNGPAGYEGLTYALDYGGVRFISLHSEVFGDPHRLGEEQLAWLERQLAENPSRYTIVFSHDPAYPAGPHTLSSLDAYPQERDRLWGLLRQYGATAYFAGHEHLYNRRAIDGVTQVIAGASGSWPYGGFGGDYMHHVVAEVRPDGIAFVVYDIEGVERDRFVLTAERPTAAAAESR